VNADRVVKKVPLELSERISGTNLVILNGQGIDVILGMSWMKMHKAILDIAMLALIKHQFHVPTCRVNV
jgi:hypothetical protein